MTKYKFTNGPWLYEQNGFIESSYMPIISLKNTGIVPFSKKEGNIKIICLAPTLHEVVTKCQAILSNYLEPEGKSKEDVIKEFLYILDDKELVIKLKELEI